MVAEWLLVIVYTGVPLSFSGDWHMEGILAFGQAYNTKNRVSSPALRNSWKTTRIELGRALASVLNAGSDALLQAYTEFERFFLLSSACPGIAEFNAKGTDVSCDYDV